MGVGVKIFDRQRLHLVEQIVPEMEHSPLTDIDHDPVIGKGCDDADPHHTGQMEQVSGKAAKVVRTCLQHRGDIVIHQSLRKGGSYHGGDGSDHNTEDHKQKWKFIVMKHISDDPIDQLCG